MRKIRPEDVDISEAEPMNEFVFQHVVIDWFLKLEEDISDLKKLIEDHE